MLFLSLPGVMGLDYTDVDSYYRLDNATTVSSTISLDSVNVPLRNGTILSSPIIGVTGKIGQAYNFSNRGYVNLTDVDYAGNLSFGLWLNKNKNGAAYDVALSKSFDGSQRSWAIYSNPDGSQGITCAWSVANAQRWDTAYHANTPNTGQWYFTMCVYNADTDTMQTWIDGVLDNTHTVAGAAEGNAARWTISKDSYAASGYFNATIDEVMFFAKVLNSSDIGLLNASWTYPVIASSDLIFSNNSNAAPVTTAADENGAFWVFGNWTLSNGSIITDGEGGCNFTNVGTYVGVYNSSLGLWVINQSQSFSTHGSRSYSLNCSHWTNSSFSLDRAENIYITNIAPVIVFDAVNTTTAYYGLVNNVMIEYNVAVWNWTVNVTDDDESGWTYYLYNSSGHLMQTGSGTSSNQLSFTTPAEFFRWFENPYNLTVVWNDTGAENNRTNTSIRFYVNDTVSPVITWFSPANASSFDKSAGGQIEFFSQCSDPALYRYNLTVYNISTPIYSYQEVNILGTIWNNQTFISVGQFATLNNATNYSHSVMTLCADSHTGEALAEVWLPEKDFVEDMTFREQGISLFIKEKENIASFEPVYKLDRVSFDIHLKMPSKTLTIDLYGTDITPVRNKLGYACHAVLSNPITKEPAYWFDADMPGLESCKLVCLGSDHCQAIVTLKEAAKELPIESVGEVNIYNETRYFSVYDSSVLTVDWSGLVCGERYPDNVHNLTFEGEGITNCTLHINDRLYDGWTSDCGNITIETNIGRQYLELSFLDAFNASTVDHCTIWTDKLDQDVGDFMWLIILGVVWGFLVFMSFSSAPALSIVGGLVGIFVSYELMAYSMVLAGIFLLFNVVIIFKR